MSERRVRVARTFEEVEALRGAWEALDFETASADIDYHLTFLRNSPTAPKPYVVLMERDGAPEALAVGRVEELPLPAKLGYATLYKPRLRTLTVSQGGLVGADAERAPKLLETLTAAMREESLELLRLRAVAVGSPIYALATGRTGPLVRQHFSTPDDHWRAAIPGSYEEFLKTRSSKSRGSIKRYARRLEEQFGEGLTVRSFTSPEEADELMRDSKAVSVKTYQHELGVGVVESGPEAALRALALEKGWFRGFVLYLEGVPSAYWHGLLYRRTYFTGATGYDPAHRDLRLGTYILGTMIDRLSGEIDWMDFGLGEAEYKRRFGDENRPKEDVLVFAPRARPIAVNLVRSGILGASRVGSAALARAGRTDELRRRWRRRLNRRGQEA